MRWPQEECALVSLHGRTLYRIVPHLQPGARILALSWDESTPRAVAWRAAVRAVASRPAPAPRPASSRHLRDVPIGSTDMARIAIIGGGSMGEALLAGLLRAGRHGKVGILDTRLERSKKHDAKGRSQQNNQYAGRKTALVGISHG